MRELRRMAWAAAVAAAAGGPAFGQTLGGNLGTSTTTQSGNTQGGTTLGGNTLSGNSGQTGNSGQGGNTLQGTALMTSPAAPKITAPSMLTTSSNTNMAASNFLTRTYSNPYYAGSSTVYNYSATGGNPGGFGAQSFGTASGANAGRAGQGVTGSVNSQDPGGVIVPLPKQIAYPAQLQFQVPVVPNQVFTEIRTGIDRSTMIANPRAVQVVMDGPNVILRGSVKDNDEYRLVESVVRITPGVREIKNELVYPK